MKTCRFRRGLGQGSSELSNAGLVWFIQSAIRVVLLVRSSSSYSLGSTQNTDRQGQSHTLKIQLCINYTTKNIKARRRT
jgi:hypothetical protein